MDPGTLTVVVKSVDSRVERSYSNDLMLSWAPMWYPGGDALLLAARRQPGGVGQAFTTNWIWTLAASRACWSIP